MNRTKDIGLSFKDVDLKAGIVTGYLSHFGSLDSDGDVIQKGSFLKTIAEKGPSAKKPRIKHLLDHDFNVGTFQVLQEDDYGLYYESKAGQYPDGRNFLLYVEDGVITEHSIGFKVVNQYPKSDHNLITELNLWEGSSLRKWGANPNTPITGLKDFEDLLEAQKKMYKALKYGKYTDDEMVRIEREHKSITELISEFIKTTQPNAEKSETTVPSEKGEDPQIFFKTFTTAFSNGIGRGEGS